MAQIRKYILIPLLALSFSSDLAARKFYDDDPIRSDPPPLPVGKVKARELSAAYDFLQNTFSTPGEKQNKKKPIYAQGINTLGEAPDSAWFRNRNKAAMTVEEASRGPAQGNAPATDGPWKILAAKTEGVTPGFRIEDSHGRRYVLKFDPPDYPELATAADVIGSKFFYALGYNTPENYIVRFMRSQLTVTPQTTLRDNQGRKRLMTDADVDKVLKYLRKDPAGRYRGMASLFIKGEVAGPFLFYGTRRDDPNDIVVHENRRDLRGLYVMAAWLNHTDIKSLNSLDSVVEENGLRYVKHYLLDFGASLGSDSIEPKSPIGGNEYFIDPKPALIRVATLGLYSPAWERVHYPHITGVGNFEAKVFNPDDWKSDYPNPAFDNRLPDDTFWGARQVMALREDQIRAMVETGEYSDPEAAGYITGILMRRREKIARVFFNRVLPLDRFRITNQALEFDDLAAQYNVAAPRAYSIQWSRFDNETEQKFPLSGRKDFSLPTAAAEGQATRYLAADIQSGEPGKTMTVYVRQKGARAEVVGVDRRWN